MKTTDLPKLEFAYMVLVTPDLPRLRDWYCDNLGFRCIHSGEFAELGTTFAVLEGHGMRLELTSRANSAVQPLPTSEFPECLDHAGWKVLTLKCADLPAMDAHLHQKGADIVWSLRPLGGRVLSTQLRDADGNLLNLVGDVVGVV